MRGVERRDPGSRAPVESRHDGEAGFTLVELLVAMLILVVGILAMAGSTGSIFTQLRVSKARTERLSAVQYSAAQLQAQGFNNIASSCSSWNQTIGRYTVTCSSSSVNNNLLKLQLLSNGPKYDGTWQTNVQDTFVVQIAR